MTPSQGKQSYSSFFNSISFLLRVLAKPKKEILFMTLHKNALESLQAFALKNKNAGNFKAHITFPYSGYGKEFKVKIEANPKSSAHVMMALQVAQNEIQEQFKNGSLATWAQCSPYLWQPCSHENTDRESCLTLGFGRGTPTELGLKTQLSIPGNSKIQTQNFALCKLLKNGTDLERFLEIITSFKGPFCIWHTQNNSRNVITFKAPENGASALIIDRMARSFQPTLRKLPAHSTRPNTIMKYSTNAIVEYDAFEIFYSF
jgi:hypothetical protein